jgi:hypothetical protein
MRDIVLSNDRYIAALERIKKQIENGSDLISEDSNDIGNKYTSCTWGLCSRYREQWPDEEDWLSEYNDKIVNSRYQDNGQHCPMDKDQDENSMAFGCFYRCRVFQDGLRDREEAIKLYEITIKEKS